MAILLAIMAGFLLALVAPAIYRRAPRVTGWLLALYPLATVTMLGWHLPALARGETARVVYEWAPSLNLRLSFLLDGLSGLFALLISGIGVLVLIYANGYMPREPRTGRFYSFLLVFMASMLGLVLSDNLLALFVFWELTSFSSFFLIGFESERDAARGAAVQALLVTALGEQALLAGLLLLAHLGGSFELSQLLTQGQSIREHALYLPTLLLVLAGACTKSAQFPFHFWLPNAMQAPTPVSAYLHSATMVKAGVYLLARLTPALAGTAAWTTAVTTIGAATMLVGGYLALVASDLKQILAYSTVSALGTFVLLLGVGESAGVEACLVFLLAHALYKGALFMVAGAIDHETGTRDVSRLGGLRRAMPVTATAALLAAASLAGLIPFLGFLGKELWFAAMWEAPTASRPLSALAVLTGSAFVGVALIAGVGPFFGRRGQFEQEHSHEAPLALWLGPLILGVAGLLLGLFPGVPARWIATPAVAAVLQGTRGAAEAVKLQLWHGWNAALAMSIVSIVLGVLIYFGRGGLRSLQARLRPLAALGPAQWYEWSISGLNLVASVQTRVLQNGSLHNYVLVVVATTLCLAGPALLSWEIPSELTLPRWYELAVSVMILVGAISAVRAESRFAAVASLGAVGYGVALLYVFFAAPDLAMTQFMIETLTVVLFVLVIYRLPRFSTFSSRLARLRDALIAILVATLTASLVMGVTSIEHLRPVSDYYAEHSVPRAHGRNVVNVILVDYRAFDTLGEITVLTVAALGVYALVRLRLPTKEKN